MFEKSFAPFEHSLSNGPRRCLEGEFAARPDDVAEAFAGSSVDGFAGVLSLAIAGCPDAIVELLVPIFEGSGVSASKTGRVCLAQVIAARSEELAAVFAGSDASGRAALGAEVVGACAAELAGG